MRKPNNIIYLTTLTGIKGSNMSKPETDKTLFENKFITPKELSEILKVTSRTVVNMAKRNEIPGIRVGNRWRFDTSVVMKFLKEKGTNNVNSI